MAMTLEEVLHDDAVGEKINLFADLVLSGEYEKAQKVAVTIPLLPERAKLRKRLFGKEHLIEDGYDLSLANAEYGENWLNEPDEEE